MTHIDIITILIFNFCSFIPKTKLVIIISGELLRRFINHNYYTCAKFGRTDNDDKRTVKTSKWQ
jgi:hypothetical protein